MKRLLLIHPAIGHEPGRPYVRSWQMEPLAMAVLAGLTPADWQITFYDDRIEPVPADTAADLVAISVETFTARRAYQLAAAYRRRGIPVVMGGYHATLCADEVARHADAVCVGDAEPVWVELLADVAAGRLAARYQGKAAPVVSTRPDRRIFAGRRYFKLALVEAGRGCPAHCEFCSITAYNHAQWRPRAVAEIVADIRAAARRDVFFVDDNFAGDHQHARDVCAALAPLRLRWMAQAGVSVAADEELVRAMAASGCIGLLLGFESLAAGNLAAMNKPGNRAPEFSQRLATLRRHGIAVYGTFVFGYPADTPALIAETVRFALREKLFLAAFNHLIPFPGTPLYATLNQAGRLRPADWWLDPGYRFGDAPFMPEGMSAEELRAACHAARRRFFSLRGITQRMEFSANLCTLHRATAYVGINMLLHREVARKRGLPLGGPEPQ